MPLLWAITSFCHLSSHFRDDLKGKEEVIVIGMKPIETMADAFPTSLIFLMILSLTLYLITTLHWLHLTKKPRVRLSDNKNLDIVKADPKNPYPLSAIFFIYWGLACPLGISAWGGISPPVENLMTKDLLTLALGGVWLAALMPLILGASFVLLYASPPSLIYLEERGLLQLSHRWRSWAWLLFIVGVSLILFAL